jgi:hypothetical protein
VPPRKLSSATSAQQSEAKLSYLAYSSPRAHLANKGHSQLTSHSPRKHAAYVALTSRLPRKLTTHNSPRKLTSLTLRCSPGSQLPHLAPAQKPRSHYRTSSLHGMTRPPQCRGIRLRGRRDEVWQALESEPLCSRPHGNDAGSALTNLTSTTQLTLLRTLARLAHLTSGSSLNPHSPRAPR